MHKRKDVKSMSNVKNKVNDSRELLKKGKRNIIDIIFSRTSFAILALALQVIVLIFLFLKFGHLLVHYYATVAILALFMILYITNSDSDQETKIMWLAVLLVLPVTGIFLYFYIKFEIGHRALKKRIDEVDNESGALLGRSKYMDEFDKEYPLDAAVGKYLYNTSGFPAYKNCETSYCNIGEIFLERLSGDLRNAKEFIFLEYFIVEDGKMWGQIENILKEKAAEGVEIKVLYDGTCEFARLPESYPEYLKSYGIECRVFSPIKAFVSTHYNFRDHRKIAVIDGNIAYTGGLNLADEYANFIHPYGHWKDTSLRICGEAVKTYTLMFLQIWQLEDEKRSYDKYLRAPYKTYNDEKGYVIPYGDCPLDDYYVGEMVYTHILNISKDYVHIMTPYLIIGNELMNALKFAALRGVDVSIIMPAVSDHMLAYALAKTDYKQLIESGVKIYEYTPGFVHAKSFVSDDVRGTVGTINMDYRSLRHHFECGAYLCGTSSIKELEDDFNETIEKCHLVTLEEAKHIGAKWKIVGCVSKPFASLM